MSTGNGRPPGRPPHKNSKAAPLQPGDEVGAYTYAQLLRMDRRYVAAAEEAIRLGLERRTSTFAEQQTGASDRSRGMETGTHGAMLQWARIGVVMVMCSWHDALAADQLPREIVGNWCLAIERMLPEFELARTAGCWRPRSRPYVALAILFVIDCSTNAKDLTSVGLPTQLLATRGKPAADNMLRLRAR